MWLMLVFGLAAEVSAQPAAPEEGRSRFCAVDIYLDSKGTPLAAYQLEFAVTNHPAKIVGIEGGEHAAFREAPFYDPKAIQNERVIIGAFSTLDSDKLPTGRMRVATIHLQITTDEAPQCELKLNVAADVDARKISVEAGCEERKPK
jgi:hypothetical protein